MGQTFSIVAAASVLAIAVLLLPVKGQKRTGVRLGRLYPGDGPGHAASPPEASYGQVYGYILSLSDAEAIISSARRAGITVGHNRYLVLWAAVTAALPATLVFAGIPAYAALALPVCAFSAPKALIAYLEHRKSGMLAQQSERLTSDIALLLRCGIPLDEAFTISFEEAALPMKAVLEHHLGPFSLGDDPGSSLLALARELRSADLELVAMAAATARETGSDIRRIMDGIGEAVRERAAIRRELATLTVQSRLSAKVVAALPFIFLLLSALISRETVTLLFTTVPGLVMLLIGAALDVAGFIVIRRILEVPS